MDSPFVFHDGHWYVCPTFNRRPSARLFLEILTALLQRHPPTSILVLRRMSEAEVMLLGRYRRDFDAEAFAIMAPTDEAKLGKPTARRGRAAP